MDPDLENLKNKLGLGSISPGPSLSVTTAPHVGNLTVGTAAPAAGSITLAKPATPSLASSPNGPNFNIGNSPNPASISLQGQNINLRPISANTIGASPNNPVKVAPYTPGNPSNPTPVNIKPTVTPPTAPMPTQMGKPNNQLAQVAQAKSQGVASQGAFNQPLAKITQQQPAMPVGSSGSQSLQSGAIEVGKDVGKFGVNMAKGLAAPFEYLGKTDIINPIRSDVASFTNNPTANTAIVNQQRSLLQPRQLASNVAQAGLDIAAPEASGLIEKGVQYGVGLAAPETATELATRLGLGLGGGNAVLDNTVKYGVPIATGAALGGPYNVASQVGSNQKLDPQTIAKAYAQGTGYGLAFGAGGEAVNAGIHGLVSVGGKLISTAGQPAIKAAEQASGLPAANLVNDNEAGTLRDYADYKTGGYTPDNETLNNLQMQARNAAKTAGVDITSGAPQEVTDRIYQYLSQRTNFITAHNQVAQGGYIGGIGASSYPEAQAAGTTFPGSDTLSRFEADDSQATTTPLAPGYNDDLVNILHHPTLFKDYPELANVKVSVQDLKPGTHAVYIPEKNTIVVDSKDAANPDTFKATLMHETQHAIQKIEGFTQGTSSKAAGDYSAYRQNPGEQEAHTVQDRVNMTPQERAASPIPIAKPQPKIISDFISKIAKSEDGDTYGYKSTKDFVDDYAKMLQDIEKSAKGGQLIDTTGPNDAYGSGVRRTSEHSPFYRQYFAENGHAPSKAAYTEEAQRELESGHGAFGASSTYQTLKARESPAAGTPYDTPQIIAARELAKSIPNTMDINTPERQALRQELADKNYGTGAVNKNKRLDLVIGPPAAGKTSTLVGPLAQKYGSIVLDSDAIKKQLPEFNKGVGSAATHDESAYISDDLMSRKAMKAGDNIVAARLGKNASTMQQYMDLAKSKGYEVHLHDMSLPADKAAARAASRFGETGQFVDPHYILHNVGDKTDFVYNKIKKEATTYGQYNADVPRGETPKLIDSSPGYEQPLRQGRTNDTGGNQVNGGEPNSPGTIKVQRTPSQAQSIKVATPEFAGPLNLANNPNLNETAFDPADLVKISKVDEDSKSLLYDPRSLSTQRGESGEPGVPTQTEELKGADLHYKPDQRAPMSDEELGSLAKNAPVPTMEEILAKRGANMTPEPTNASDRLNESDAQVHELLSGGGKRSEAIAYYVEHHDMSKAQATHRVNIVQREINLHRSNPNPVIDKYSVQHGSPEDTRTPVLNTREIHNNVTAQLQKVNDLSNKLDKHDVALLDLHSKDPVEIAKTAHDPEAFMEVANAFKDLNDITHAYGFNMGQPLPYRQQYGSRLIFDMEDPESREAFMKVATPTDKGYTLPRTIKDYDEAAKYGIKRKNANAVEDINQDAQERISDLKKLALQQGLEDAYPGKVAVGQIGRDAEDGKIYKELSIPNGAHLSMPSDIADKINERSRIETAPDLGVPKGHIKGAVAKSLGMSDEVKSQFNRMHEAQAKLSENDQRLLYLYDNGAKLDDLKPDNPTRFNTAVTAMQKALDATASAREQVTGLKSLRPQNELPHYFEATPERMDELQIPARDRLEDYPGFQDSHGQYNSYLQAFAKDQLKPLFKNPFEAAEYFGGKAAGGIKNQALFTTLAHAAPDDIAERGVRTSDLEGKPFSQAAGRLPFDVSKKLDKSLGGLREAWEPKTAIGRGVEGSIKIAGRVTKASLWLGSFFHYSNLAKNIVGLDGISGHPIIAGKGLGQALEDSVSRGGYEDLIDHYRETGTLQSARDMGIVLSDGKKALSRYEDANVLALVDAAKKNGVDPNSPEGTDLGRIYNAVLGRRNSAVEASNPTIEKFLNYTTLAPHYMTTQLRLMADAILPKKYGGAGYDKPISLYTPGGAARGTVLGARLFEAATAITLGIILTHKFPDPKQLAQEAGLYPNNPVPNAMMNSKNSKGESQVMNMPTDQLGLIFGLLTDPKHFFQSRFSPIGTFGTSLITNENWNEEPLTTPGQPNALGTRIVHAAENAFTPIGVQNFTNPQHNQNNPDILQGIAEEFGGRLKTNPNDPQVKANSAYFALNSSITKTLTNGQFSQLDPSLKNVSWQQAQQFVNTFNSLHPTNTTSATGQKFPQDYNASSAEVKYNAYTMTDPTSGARVLSPVYYADKKLENGTAGYPSSPLYKLTGTGTDVDGQKAPQALVALEYQHQQDPAAKTDILNANGGQKGWLSNYETKLGNYDQNYQKNMTSYFQSLGWTPKAINTYWSNHPSMPDPIEAVNFPQSTTNLMNTYSTMAANDPTGAAQFFTQHSQVLGDAFDLEAQHSNALRKASGELEIQGYPTETPQVTKLLNSMPTGSTTADKSARSAIINNNPAVNQFLADSALYESLSKGAQFRYVNPASPSKTEGQNVNAGGQAGQTFLKDTSSLGSYDIGENKTTGQYSFMQGGGFPAGSASTAASSSTSDGPLIAMPGYPKKPPRHSAGKLRLQKERAKTIRIRKANLKPVQILHGGGPLHASNVIHIAK